MSPTSYQTAPPRVACRSSGENYHIIAPRLCQSFFSRAGHFFAARGMGGCFHGCKPRRSVVKYLRSRPRAGNARETARPFPPCQESRPPAARAVTDPGARPVLALPRPIPDGPPPLSGANKGGKRVPPPPKQGPQPDPPFLREVWRAAALQSAIVSPGSAGRAGSLRPWAQTFLKHWRKKIAAGELFRHARKRFKPGGTAKAPFVPAHGESHGRERGNLFFVSA